MPGRSPSKDLVNLDGTSFGESYTKEVLPPMYVQLMERSDSNSLWSSRLPLV